MKREQIEKLFGPTWVDFLAPFVQSDKFKAILDALGAKKKEAEEKKVGIFPDQKNLFRAFKELALPDVRVIILGMDPYPLPGYATGLAFAHPMDKKVAPSLEKIIDAIETDCYDGLQFDKNQFDCTLDHWTKQGILLLNAALTVEEKLPGSHAEIWKPFTTYVIDKLVAVRNDLIFMAWGKDAQTFTANIHFVKHFVLTDEHPSNAAREKRKWACEHFSTANAMITGNKLGEPIKWMHL